MDKIISVNGLKKSFGENEILKDINFLSAAAMLPALSAPPARENQQC